MTAEDTVVGTPRSAVSALHVLGRSSHVVEELPPFPATALAVREDVVESHASVAADPLERDLLSQQVADQKWPGDMQELGCLPGGQLLTLWDQRDRLASAHRLDHALQRKERRGRERDLPPVRADETSQRMLCPKLGQ